VPTIRTIRLPRTARPFPGSALPWTFVEGAGMGIALSEDAKELILLQDFLDTDIVAEL